MPAYSVSEPILYDPVPMLSSKHFTASPNTDDALVLENEFASESVRELGSEQKSESNVSNRVDHNQLPITINGIAMESSSAEHSTLEANIDSESPDNLDNPLAISEEVLPGPTSACPIMKTYSKITSKFVVELEIIIELFSAIIYAVWGICLAICMTLIPRRFRYKDVTGKTILITGAGSGIGRLMAEKFALKHGAKVVAWDINEKGNEETVKSIRLAGGHCYGFIVDVSSREAIYKAAHRVKTEVGKVDILINNAGIVTGKRLLETPDESILKTFEVNALSNFWTVKAFLPDMMERGSGHIVTIASLAGLFGTNRLVDYCASKFAAVGFDEALKNEIKVELGHKNIHSTLVCPYYINTGMFDGVRSKLIPLLKPEPVVNDIVAGILTNQEQIVIPRSVYILIVLKLIVPGEVGRRVATAFGITGAMLSFKGSNKAKGSKLHHSVLPVAVVNQENPIPKLVTGKNGRKSKK